jgi:hypothetical protein|uniref:Akirin n=1 Tax=Panagrolaimus sp. PS1159 TaxID=55785 RepID=A0AC35GR67_9BILA
MTCGLAVKRPHDYEAFLGTDGGVDAKRPRQTSSHCSPFRPQLGTLAASLNSLPHSSTLNLLRETERENDNSPFASIAGKYQLSSSQLDSYLTAEIRSLKRRKLIPRRQFADSCAMAAASESGSNYRKAPGSPTSSHSGSDSESESATGNTQASSMQNIYNKPQFNFNQVKLICERLLKQQEVQLRHEYETVLNKKLEEQHEQYVQFAKEQNPSPLNSDFSYLN